jgi:hypothetical protein
LTRRTLFAVTVAGTVAACSGLGPSAGTPALTLRGSASATAEPAYRRESSPSDDMAQPLAVTRKLVQISQPAYVDKIVKVREFKVPDNQVATDSIIVGPDRNLWFTEYGAIVRLTVEGQMRATSLRSGQPEPGLLTSGPDGNIWANAAQLPPPNRSRETPLSLTWYLLYRVTPEGRFTAFPLPLNTNFFPTGLLTVGSALYFGLPILAVIHGDDEYRNFLATISTTDGIVKKIASVPLTSGTADSYIMALLAPGPRIWFYDFAGGLHVCTIAGKCFFRQSAYPYRLVDTLQGTPLAYSPTDQDIYIENQNFYTIYRYSVSGKPLRAYKNLAFAYGFGSLAYYRGNIWITLGGDDKARPNLGRLTPAGQFSEISLPFVGPTAAVTALVGGPDGHLWYLRGYHVGEILSKI